MRNERRILFNTTVLSAAEGLGQLANLILIASFARVFGASVMGYYSVGMSVGAVAAIFVALGTQGLLIRDISREPACAPDRLGVLLPIQTLLVPIAWVIATAIGVLLVGNRSATGVIAAACGYQVLLPLATLLLLPLQARELMVITSACSLLHRVLILVLGGVALWLGASAGTVAMAFVIGVLCLLPVAWVQTSRRFGRPKLRFSPGEALELYRRASPFLGLAALSVLYSRGAAILLSALTTARVVGLYAVADRLMVAVGLGPLMFNAAVYPALSRVAHDSSAEARALTARCLRLLLVVAIPFAALATIFAADIIHLFFGSTFLGAARALQVLAWTLPIRGAQSLMGSQLAALNQQKALARARLTGLCIFVVIAPLLIIYLGYVGTAWAVLCCDSVQMLLYWQLLRAVGGAPALAASFLAPAAAAAGATVIGVLLASHALAVRLTATVLVMAAGMWLFGAIRGHDLRFLRALVNAKD